MPGSAVLWSRLGEQRRGQLPSPALETNSAVTAPNTTSAVKTTVRRNTLVFNKPQQKDFGVKSPSYTSTPSGTSSPMTSSVGKSWADSVEDEQAEIASHVFAMTEPSHEYTLMASAVARQAQRLEETEATLTQQADRISQLGDEIKGQTIRIEELEVGLKEQTGRVTELEANDTERRARIADLLDQADQKSARVSKLEEDLNQKIQTIQVLELKLAEKISVSQSDSSTEVEVDDAGETTTAEPQSELNTLHPNQETKLDDCNTSSDASGTVRNTISGHPQESNGSQQSPLFESEFPALSTSDFPTLGSPTSVRYVTAANIKKLPPPPPARTLKLGIDTTKFQKKAVAGSSGSRHTTAEAPKFDVGKDIRRMSKEEREPYGCGPTVRIMMGKEVVAALPKYMFMQVSPKALKYWTENPTAPVIKFEAGCMAKGALDRHMEWLMMHTYCDRVFSVSLKDENDDRYNLELIRCARVLGLHSMYMGHFTRLYCQKIRDGPSNELVALVEELAYTDDEPVFDCLANYLSMPRIKSKADQQLARLPKLAKKVEAIIARNNAAQDKTMVKGKGKKGLHARLSGADRL